MSRYSFKTVKNDKIYSVAYGYDRPLQEYFIQVFDNTMPEDEECIIWEGSHMTNKSNSEILEIFEQWDVPGDHLQQVALDLPF